MLLDNLCSDEYVSGLFKSRLAYTMTSIDFLLIGGECENLNELVNCIPTEENSDYDYYNLFIFSVSFLDSFFKLFSICFQTITSPKILI
jgi:hypothetical protein